jgi:hypothetical protein
VDAVALSPVVFAFAAVAFTLAFAFAVSLLVQAPVTAANIMIINNEIVLLTLSLLLIG